jgi:hypothetical protein
MAWDSTGSLRQPRETLAHCNADMVYPDGRDERGFGRRAALSLLAVSLPNPSKRRSMNLQRRRSSSNGSRGRQGRCSLAPGLTRCTGTSAARAARLPSTAGRPGENGSGDGARVLYSPQGRKIGSEWVPWASEYACPWHPFSKFEQSVGSETTIIESQKSRGRFISRPRYSGAGVWTVNAPSKTPSLTPPYNPPPEYRGREQSGRHFSDFR